MGDPRNRLIAEKVMGCTHFECRAADEDVWCSDDGVIWWPLIDYLTDKNACHEALETFDEFEARKHSDGVEIYYGVEVRNWVTESTPFIYGHAVAPTFNEAGVEAMLKAKESQ